MCVSKKSIRFVFSAATPSLVLRSRIYRIRIHSGCGACVGERESRSMFVRHVLYTHLYTYIYYIYPVIN